MIRVVWAARERTQKVARETFRALAEETRDLLGEGIGRLYPDWRAEHRRICKTL